MSSTKEANQGARDILTHSSGPSRLETDSSHVPMLSQPDFALNVIRKAATSVQKNMAA